MIKIAGSVIIPEKEIEAVLNTILDLPLASKYTLGLVDYFRKKLDENKQPVEEATATKEVTDDSNTSDNSGT